MAEKPSEVSHLFPLDRPPKDPAGILGSGRKCEAKFLPRNLKQVVESGFGTFRKLSPPIPLKIAS